MIKRLDLKSDFLKYIVVLMSGTLISQVINLGMSIPIFRYFYSPEEAAELGIFLRIIGVGGALATARYEFALPIAKADSHSFRLYHVALRTTVMVTLISSVAILVPVILAGSWSEILFYAMLPIGLFLMAYYSIGTNWAIRTKAFRTISVSKVMSASSSSSLKLLFGWLGFGYIGLILGTIFGLFAGNIGFARGFIKANRRFRIKSKSPRNFVLAKEYSEFPKVNLPHTLMDLGRELLVAIVISELFSMAIFGLYDQSYRMLRLPLMLAGAAISQVFFQRCAEKFNKGEDILPMILKSTKILALISIVPFTVIFFFGGDLFAFVFSEKWRDAGEFSEIMAPWFMLNFIASPISFLPLILGKQRQFFLLASIGAISMLASVIIPSMAFQADIKTTLWILSSTQVAYFVFVIFKIIQYIKRARLAT